MNAITLIASLVVLAPPSAVTVQGSLRTAGGAPVDGDYGLTIRIFDAAADGDPLHEKLIVAAPVASGVFSATLDVGPSLFDGPGDRWVEVQVESEPALPRVKMASVPTALVAGRALSLSCSGCVTGAMLAADITAPFATTASLSSVAFSGSYDDLQGAPTLSAVALSGSYDDLQGAPTLSAVALSGSYDDLQGTPALAAVALSGSYDDLAGGPDLSGYGALAGANQWAQPQTFNADVNMAGNQALLFRFQNSSGEPTACDATKSGLAYFDPDLKRLFVCDGAEFVEFANVGKLGTESNPGASCRAILSANGASPSAVYWIKPAAEAYQAYCDMKLGGGGWTLALNLDTSDGHVMWWANPLWTDAETHGDVSTPLVGDLKGPAFMDLAEEPAYLVVIHDNGAVIGWKSFTRTGPATLHDAMQLGDNTLIGSDVIASDLGAVHAQERLVRISTALYANHCVSTGGSCTSGTVGSPDGDRLGSHEAVPSDNNGGGLGNWHDMAYCCNAPGYAGKTCNGSAFRTVSEATAGWAHQLGTFGTDSFAPMTGTQTDAGCGNANWAKASSINYDYAIFVGGAP